MKIEFSWKLPRSLEEWLIALILSILILGVGFYAMGVI
jgi:hypothetical protein